MAKHGKVKDSGAYFVINPASRKVIVPHVHKSIGTVGDHNSEQITFECPQMIDGHDISQCASRYVTWVNVRGEVGHDELQITQVEQGTEGMLYLSWTVRNGLTVAKGIIQFSVHFEDFDDDGNILYRWGTATCKDCEILDSVNAVLGAYKAVYVSGDTLVFADYNVVNDGVLKLETKGIIPEGILGITENGTYDVGRFAQVDVSVNENPPEITISEDGKVIATEGEATSEVQLSNKHDPDFIAENIKSGANIFGVEGTLNQKVTGKVILNGSGGLRVWCYNGYDTVKATVIDLTANTSSIITVVKNSPVILVPTSLFQPYGGNNVLEIAGGSLVETSADNSVFIVKATSDDFEFKVS